LSLEVTVVHEGIQTPHARGLGAWLTRIAPKAARGAVTVAIVGDPKMRALNRKYRRKDRVTDVLSFPSEKGSGAFFAPKTAGKRHPTPFWGEIVIARGMAARQARSLGHPLRLELRILALHGLLHLLGYDHEVDKGDMARVEARLRRRGGLPEGLISRSS
jgi:probable rRNA maturation factor